MLTRGVFRRLCRARDMLRETPDEPLTIREIAREAEISPFHFIRQFQSLFGKTPHQFRIQARLDRAKTLLTLSDYSVTDVCMEVGFSSLGTFSDLFARRVGAAPSVYRRQVRAIMPVPGVLPPALTPGCLTLMGEAFAIFEKQRLAAPGDAGLASAGPRVRRLGRINADQTQQHHGRQSGEGVALLHGGVRLREEA